MKNILSLFILNVWMSLLILLSFSCKKDEVSLSSGIQFESGLVQLAEGTETTVILTLDHPANQDGSIVLSVTGNAIYDDNFTTNPQVKNKFATILISKGDKEVKFKVNATNNTVFDGGKFIFLTLNVASEGFKLGERESTRLEILDDEAPTLVSFSKTIQQVDECDDNGTSITLAFSGPALGSGSITIGASYPNAQYNKDFRTDPELQGNSFTLNILPGQTSKSFMVYPVHNPLFIHDQQIVFTINLAEGVAQKGTNISSTLTIVNCDPQPLANFESSSGSLAENNTDGITINIPLTNPIPAEGSITITFTSVSTYYGLGFTTLPARLTSNTIKLNLASMDTGAKFIVFPVDNSNCESTERSVHFKISAVDGSIEKGNGLDYSLVLIDDEEVITANFATSDGVISEGSSSGLDIKIDFSKPIVNAGVLEIYSDNYEIFRWRTEPAFQWNYSSNDMQLQVLPNELSKQFTFYPIDNSTRNNDLVLSFTIDSYSGCVRGPLSNRFIITIKDDD